MKQAQEEFCFRAAEIAGCTYGIESQGHLVDTRSSIASDCEFLLGKLWKPACNGQHSHISAKNRFTTCTESGMMYLPAEIATGISTQWMTYMSMKPESQASAVSGGDAETKDVPRMPCRDEPQLPGPPSEPIGALIAAIGAVAKLLTKAEIKEDSEAQLAMDTEFYKLQGDGTTGTWDLSQVRAKKDVMREARSKGETTHYGRVFGIASIKGSELPVGHKDRKHKGRYVYDGRPGATRDENNSTALFQDRGSSPATIETSKIVDGYGLLSGHEEEVSDAPQAYTQSLLRGAKTWVSLPSEYWPEHFHKIEDPVVPLRYSLYGHPDAGTF